MTDDEFLTTEEVLEYLHLNLADRLSARSRPARSRPIRVGRQWRFRRRDIDDVADRQPPSLRHAGPTATTAERPRVLVVDDEESVREPAREDARRGDYEVDTAADGAAAVERLRAADFDLLDHRPADARHGRAVGDS